MFVEQSAERIRMVRTLFVLAGLIPCAVLAGAAVWRHSGGHAEAIERECETLLGLPLEIGGVEHLRPGAMRLAKVELLSPDGAAIIALQKVDVETSATEVRLTVPRLECTPRAAAAFAGLAGDWLSQPQRFPAAVVVDVGELVWGAGAADAGGRGLRVECVASDGVRAVRARREPETSEELRVLSTVAAERAGASGSQPDSPASRRIEVHCAVEEPLPAAIVAAVAGIPEAAGRAIGADARIRGHVDAVMQDGRWTGDCDGLVERIDLASCTARAAHRLAGEATVSIPRFRIEAGRLADCQLDCSATAGRLGQDFLDAAVRTLGCRAGPAYRSLAYDPLRSFDSLAFSLRIDGDGMLLRAPGDRGAALIQAHGIAILEEPSGTVPTERLAWLFSPPGRAAVPASDVSAWLISRLPVSAAKPAGTRTAAGGQPVRSLPAAGGKAGVPGEF